jgi:serine/threonine protein kinase
MAAKSVPCNRNEISDYFAFGDILGSGSYGKVYESIVLPRATDELNIPVAMVAIKEVKLNKASINKAYNEIKFLKTVDNPRSIKYYGCFYNPDKIEADPIMNLLGVKTIYIVMELANGLDYDSLMKTFSKIIVSPLPVVVHVQILRELALAIHDLHALGIAHQDLKPQNVMVYVNEGVISIKLIDYGISCHLLEKYGECHRIVGTEKYSDPQKIPGIPESVKAADWWAFGETTRDLRNLIKYKGDSLYAPILDIFAGLTNAKLNQDERPQPEYIVASFNELADSLLVKNSVDMQNFTQGFNTIVKLMRKH